jgi:hypothetical protein
MATPQPAFSPFFESQPMRAARPFPPRVCCMPSFVRYIRSMFTLCVFQKGAAAPFVRAARHATRRLPASFCYRGATRGAPRADRVEG